MKILSYQTFMGMVPLLLLPFHPYVQLLPLLLFQSLPPLLYQSLPPLLFQSLPPLLFKSILLLSAEEEVVHGTARYQPLLRNHNPGDGVIRLKKRIIKISLCPI